MQLCAQTVADAVYQAIRECAVTLRPDFAEAVDTARAAETETRASRVLDQVLENARIAACDNVPLCQDTGTVWVCLEVGEGLLVPGNVFSLVNDAVARAYSEGHLRMSVLTDALFERTNTGSNTPAFCEVKFAQGSGATLHVMLKGGGSDNASRVVMLAPGAGREGVVNAVLECVREKAANACPPLLVGVGVGATFDKVAGLAKHALLRPVGSPAASAEAAAFEAELLEAVNALGIGPAALGGKTTALAVHVETAPCHIAALPVAVNMGCCAMRSASIEIVPWSSERPESAACAVGTAGAAGITSANGPGGMSFAVDAACAQNDESKGSSVIGTAQAGNFAGKEAFASDVEAPQAGNGPVTGTEASQAVRLTLPFSKEDLAELRIGQEVLLSGPVLTMRDAGHERALAHLREQGALPFGLEGQTLFYAGPTPAAAGRPLGSVGPTTASRMDFATPALMDAGVAACIGKGKRSPEVIEACKRNGSVYFATVGGIAALLATCVTESELVAWEDLGTEALRRLELKDLPAFVAVDTCGRDLYREVETQA